MNQEDNEGTLETLGRWTCANCGAEMGDSSYCDACCWLFCPYCGTPSHEECRHLVAIWDSDWGFGTSPFQGLELPRLPECTNGLWPREWPEADLQRAFGDLRPLAEAYEDKDLEAEPNEYLLWNAVGMMLSEVPGSRNRFVPDSPGSSFYEDAFFEEPDRARAEIAEIIERPREGFKRLAGTYEQWEPSGQDGG